MGAFLKIVSAIYLLLVWAVVLGALTQPVGGNAYVSEAGVKLLTVLIGVSLSIPAAALYGFGQVVGDVRAIRGHLLAMRKYYEPNDRYDGM